MVGLNKKLEPELRFPEFSEVWNYNRVDEFCPLQRGFDLPISEIKQGEYPVVFSNGILKTHAEFKVKAPGIVTGRSGTIGRVTYVEKDFWPHNTSLWVTDFKGNFPLFIFYFLYQLNLDKFGTGSGVPTLNRNDVHAFKASIPKQLTEQQKIAAFLSAVDDKLTNLRRKLELLERYKRGLMQQLFTQQIRFKKDDGSDFPDWEEKALHDLAERSTIKNADDVISLVLTNSATKGVVNQQDYFDKDIANANNLEGYYVVDLGDYVYNPRVSVHAPVGPIKKNKIGKGLMSPLYTIFRFNDENDTFYEQYFHTSLWHKYMSSVANYGARHDRMNISVADFMNMPLPSPHPKEQEKMVSFLESVDKKIDSVDKQITKLGCFKSSLLQKMFV